MTVSCATSYIDQDSSGEGCDCAAGTLERCQGVAVAVGDMQAFPQVEYRSLGEISLSNTRNQRSLWKRW